jgi:hypothetical protein
MYFCVIMEERDMIDVRIKEIELRLEILKIASKYDNNPQAIRSYFQELLRTVYNNQSPLSL